MEQNDQKVILSLSVLNKMLSFLSEQPFKDVAALIQEVKEDVHKNVEEQKKLQEDKES